MISLPHPDSRTRTVEQVHLAEAPVEREAA
jgi:hypothetical protein